MSAHERAPPATWAWLGAKRMRIMEWRPFVAAGHSTVLGEIKGTTSFPGASR